MSVFRLSSCNDIIGYFLLRTFNFRLGSAYQLFHIDTVLQEAEPMKQLFTYADPVWRCCDRRAKANVLS